MTSLRVAASALLLTLAAAAAAITTGCETKVDPAQGRELYASTCARCHGADGSGGLALFDGGARPTNFQDHAFQSTRSDEQLRLGIVNGKGSGMPSFGVIFDEQQLRSLVAHLRSLDRDKTAK